MNGNVAGSDGEDSRLLWEAYEPQKGFLEAIRVEQVGSINLLFFLLGMDSV